MNDRPDQPDTSLDAYLDGELDESARRQFERRLAAEPALARELKLQRDIDAGLQRRVVAPAAPAAAPAPRSAPNVNLNGRAVTAEPAPAPVGRRPGVVARIGGRLRTWHVAALVALVLLGGVTAWQVWTLPLMRDDLAGRPDRRQPSPPQSPHAYYVALVEAGFTPEWECPPELFSEIAYNRFGAAVSYTPPEQAAVPGRMLGASYAHIFSRSTMAMLVEVDDEPVVVLIDRQDQAGEAAGEAPEALLPDDAGLYAHRRVVGPLVFYEISPFKEPQALEWFFEQAGGRG
ncbi:MAG: hypothetical protein WD009_14510 [Phycisphaeraceae bacterium]